MGAVVLLGSGSLPCSGQWEGLTIPTSRGGIDVALPAKPLDPVATALVLKTT